MFARYLHFPYIPGAGELAVDLRRDRGAGLGFLWFNAYPAEVFMGDVGALALGAALGTIAVIVRQEIVLFIMGGVFVVETLSVMIQVVSFKLTGKRVFRMAPLHHHYELKGWKENQVVVRFWIITDAARAVRPVDAEAALTWTRTARNVAACSGSASPGSRWRASSRARARACASPTRAPRRRRSPRSRAALPQAPVDDRTVHRGAFAGADLIAISPGVPLAEPVVARRRSRAALELVGDIELFARSPSCRARRAQQGARDHRHQRQDDGDRARRRAVPRGGARLRRVAGNIGAPVLDALDARLERDGWPDVFVLELSSFQLETTSSLAAERRDGAQRHRRPPRPLRGHRRLRGREGAHLRRRRRAGAEPRRPGELAMRIPAGAPSRSVDRRRSEEEWGLAQVFGEHWLAMRRRRCSMPVARLPLVGRHNAPTRSPRWRSCRAVGLPLAPLARCAARVRGLPHRMQRVGEAGGVAFFDDSKGTTVGATVAALAGLGRQLNGTARSC